MVNPVEAPRLGAGRPKAGATPLWPILPPKSRMTLSEALDLLTVPKLKQRRDLAGSPDRSTRKSDLGGGDRGHPAHR